MARELKRKKDTGEAGNGGQFGSTARDESAVAVAVAPAPHPQHEPLTNPVLSDVPSNGSGARRCWALDRGQARAYAESVDSDQARFIAMTGAENFRVEYDGALTAELTYDTDRDRGVHMYPDGDDVVLEGDTDFDRDLEFSELRLDPSDPRASVTGTLRVRAADDNGDWEHEIENFDLGTRPAARTPEGMREYLRETFSPRSRDEFRQLAMEDAQEVAEDPDEAARTAYYRGLRL